jgi:hypothetical protein
MTSEEIFKMMEEIEKHVKDVRESVLFLDKEEDKWQIEDINESVGQIESILYGWFNYECEKCETDDSIA